MYIHENVPLFLYFLSFWGTLNVLIKYMMYDFYDYDLFVVFYSV